MISSSLKASVALMLATLATFIPHLDEMSQGYSYFVSLAVLFFHPVRSIGAMLEALVCCIGGLTVGYFVASFCLLLVEYYDDSGKNMTEAHIIAIILLFLVTFCLAFIRAKYSSKRQVIATACSLVHILTFATITQMGMEETLYILPIKIDAIVLCMMVGTLISFLVCLILFPESASLKTQKNLSEMMGAIQDILDFSNHSFLAKMKNQSVSENTAYLNERLKFLDSKLNLIAKSSIEINFEPFSNISRNRNVYDDIISRIERLVLHVASLISTMTSMWDLKDASHINKNVYEEFFRGSSESITNLLFQTSDCLRTCLNMLDSKLPPDQESILHFESSYQRLLELSGEFQTLNSQMSDLSYDLDMKTYQIYFFVFGLGETSRDVLCLMEIMHGLFDRKPPKVKCGNFARNIFMNLWQSSLAFFGDIKFFQIRFAIKTAFAITMMSIPAFLDETKHTFYQYRLSWAMSSAIVVLTYSVGGTSSASFYRILGTLGGVFTSIIVWILFPDNAIGLFVAFGCISSPLFYFRLNSKYPKVFQIFLLTFTIIVLQKFSSLEDPVFDKTYSIYEIAFRRGFSVFLGVVVGMFVSRFIWPFQARTALRKGISLVYQDISSLLIQILDLIDDDVLPLVSDLQIVTKMELNLRKTHSELETLLQEANHEESNFPNRSYSQILLSIEKILNRFSSIRMSACQAGFPLSSQRKADHIEYLCRDMIDQVLLHFYVLSGAMKLKYALPPRLSDIHGSRIRLLSAISALPTPRGPFYIAYVLEDVIEELIILEDLTRSLFGSFSKVSEINDFVTDN